MSSRSVLVGLVFLLALGVSSVATAQVGTLTLDAVSCVSFGEYQSVPIPAGGRIRFHFGTPAADGSIPITVAPGDATIPLVPVASDTTIEYALDGTSTGTLRKTGGEVQIEILATLSAALRERPERLPVAYQLRFTTGIAHAKSADQSESVTVEGHPVVAPRYVQLVGAATNRPDAFPGPGEAVYAVLSGSFDWLPALP